MKLENQADQFIAMAAFRYCVSRQSTMSAWGDQWVRDTWDEFTPETRVVLARDLADELVHSRAGDPMIDAPVWRKTLAWMLERMPREDRMRARRALLYLGPKIIDPYLPPDHE